MELCFGGGPGVGVVAEDYVGGFGVGLDVVGAGFEVEFSVADGGLLGGKIREENVPI